MPTIIIIINNEVGSFKNINKKKKRANAQDHYWACKRCRPHSSAPVQLKQKVGPEELTTTEMRHSERSHVTGRKPKYPKPQRRATQVHK